MLDIYLRMFLLLERRKTNMLENNELMNIVGGATTKKFGLGVILVALGSFIVGIIDGFLRPLACNK